MTLYRVTPHDEDTVMEETEGRLHPTEDGLAFSIVPEGPTDGLEVKSPYQLGDVRLYESTNRGWEEVKTL